jgi:glutamate formiminotransferase / 5-formyltetrahydrofolate cyclo-ligase
MEKKLIECVPNISEGKRKDIIELCVDQIRNNKDLKLIDYSSDPDHNRTVITLVGPIESVIEGVFNLTKKAIELIDLNDQKGTHPRMGAIDVIPFVPLVNTTMQECVEATEKLGKMIADQLDLPVYLYANSAKSEQRKALPNIRKGEFENFDEKIKDPVWKPDFGKAIKHKTAGVVAIGAREFLIAFNVYLNTDDLNVAQDISKRIRESSGGHRFLQARGMFIEEKGLAQISMNILDFNKLPLYRVIELINIEVKRYGLVIKESELIGLIPLEALMDTFAYYTQLPSLSTTQIIETKIWD